MPKININGTIRDMTSEEENTFFAGIKREQAKERHLSLSQSEVLSMFLAQNIQSIQVDDQTAVRMRDFYPEWTDLIGKTAEPGMKFTHNGDLYEVNKAPKPHKFQADWVPGQGTESMYRLIPEFFAGDEYDPIPYKGNMALETGKFYTQSGMMYRCIRDTGIPVHEDLATLGTVQGGMFVEVASNA